jgi:DNA-binding transcriptional regulator YdaS (Cro superfamily)
MTSAAIVALSAAFAMLVVSAVARAAGRSAGTVSQWVSGNRQVPADLVPAIEAETGISRSDIRPDLWPTEAA